MALVLCQIITWFADSIYKKTFYKSCQYAALADFVSEYLLLIDHYILDDQNIFVAGGFKKGVTVKNVAKLKVTNLTELSSSYNKADSHMKLHTESIKILWSKYEHIALRSDSTDALVFLLWYARQHILGQCVFKPNQRQSTLHTHFIFK